MRTEAFRGVGVSPQQFVMCKTFAKSAAFFASEVAYADSIMGSHLVDPDIGKEDAVAKNVAYVTLRKKARMRIPLKHCRRVFSEICWGCVMINVVALAFFLAGHTSCEPQMYR